MANGIDVTLFYFCLQKVEMSKKLECNLKTTKRAKGQKYAIKYFEQEDMYVVWIMRPNEKREKLTLRKNALADIEKTIINKVEKYIGFVGEKYKKENVYVFKSKLLDEFLKMVMEGGRL